jgi:glutamate-1-semialdehyde 2,1-aminomutase
MLARGVYVHPWHNMFLCAAMTEADIDFALNVADDAFKVVKSSGPLEPVAKLAILHGLVDA